MVKTLPHIKPNSLMPTDEVRELLKLLREVALMGAETTEAREKQRALDTIKELSERLWLLQGDESSEVEPQLPSPQTAHSFSVCSFVLNRDKEILLVRQRLDGLWTLPGLHPRALESPRETTLRAMRETTGLEAISHRCLAFFSTRSHPFPTGVVPAHTVVFECRIIGGRMNPGAGILDAAFFPLHDLPDLSPEKVLSSQLYMLYSLSAQKNLLTYSD